MAILHGLKPEHLKLSCAYESLEYPAKVPIHISKSRVGSEFLHLTTLQMMLTMTLLWVLWGLRHIVLLNQFLASIADWMRSLESCYHLVSLWAQCYKEPKVFSSFCFDILAFFDILLCDHTHSCGSSNHYILTQSNSNVGSKVTCMRTLQ